MRYSYRVLASCSLFLVCGCADIAAYNNAPARIADAHRQEQRAQVGLETAQQQNQQLTADLALAELERQNLDDLVSDSQAELRALRRQMQAVDRGNAAQREQLRQLEATLGNLRQQSGAQIPVTADPIREQNKINELKLKTEEVKRQIYSLRAALQLPQASPSSVPTS